MTDVSRPSNLSCPEDPTREDSLASFHLVTTDDVQKCLNSVHPHKAVGSEMLPAIILHICARALAEPLTEVVNSSLSAGCVPFSYKISHNYKSALQIWRSLLGQKLQTCVSSSYCFPNLGILCQATAYCLSD